MIVWFHSTREQDQDENGNYDYDSFMDSRLFSTLTACSDDADKEESKELEENYRRYKDSMWRREKRLEAIKILKDNGIDANELYWHVSEEPPVMKDPRERFIYSLVVEV